MSHFYSSVNVATSNMSIVFLLPESLGVEILTIWSDALGLADFDTAICNTKQRNHFLEYISHSHLLIQHSGFIAYRYFLEWIEVRQIKLTGLILTPIDFENGKLKYALDLSKIRDLLVLSCSMETLPCNELTDILDCTLMLTDLRMDGVVAFNDKVMERMSDQLFSQLNSLAIENHGRKEYTDLVGVTVEGLKLLATKCHNLTSLSLEICNDIVDEQYLIDIISVNKKLKHITFELHYYQSSIVSDKFIYALIDNCPDLMQCNLPNFICNFSLKALAMLIKTCPNLEQCDFERVSNTTCYITYRNDYDEDTNLRIKNVQLYNYDCNIQDDNNMIQFFEILSTCDINTVGIHNACNLTDIFLIKFVSLYPHLASLTLFRCSSLLTSTSMNVLFTQCKQLHRLTFDSFNIDDMANIFSIPNTLQHISISSFPLLTTEHVIHLLANNPQLITLKIGNMCTQVNREVVSKFIRTIGLKVGYRQATKY